MSLNVGLLSASEFYEEGLRKRVIGISQAAKLLMQLFDRIENAVQVGMTPRKFKEHVHGVAMRLGINLMDEQISLCRFGQVHPDPSLYLDEALVSGEAFTLDIWIKHQGYHADLARVYTLPPYQADILHLKKGALAVQDAAIKAAKAGVRLLNIIQAVQQSAIKSGVYIVEGACGHGIGRKLHEEPMVAFCYNAGSPFSRLKAGSVITIEPLVTLKPAKLNICENGVVVLTPDIPFFYAEAMIYVGQERSIVIGR